jgi:hypothetical protein
LRPEALIWIRAPSGRVSKFDRVDPNQNGLDDRLTACGARAAVQRRKPVATLHSSTFEYLKPTDDQINTMGAVREAFRVFVDTIDNWLPSGPDKTYVLRQLRDCAMWANICITRQPDGSPR